MTTYRDPSCQLRGLKLLELLDIALGVVLVPGARAHRLPGHGFGPWSSPRHSLGSASGVGSGFGSVFDRFRSRTCSGEGTFITEESEKKINDTVASG